MKNIKQKNIFGALVLAALVSAVAAYAYFNTKTTPEYMPYSAFVERLEKGEVQSLVLSDGGTLKFKLAENEAVQYETDNPRRDDFKEMLLLNGVSVTEGSSGTGTLQSLLSVLLFVGAFIAAQKIMGKNGASSAMALNAADVSKSKEGFTDFSQIAGNEEAKESVADIVDFIKTPEKFMKYGARMPKGLIFYGPPGTGKTLMARAVAGEAGVPFFAVSGSDFVQMYVGVGASRIRELFKKARAAGKAVIFIDEIDALGRKRGGISGGNDERDQTLNALLTEMSGFSAGDGLVVIAATNRLDTLDEALLRPGRFDRVIEIGLPDKNAREMIIRHHMKGKPISDDVSIGALARQTVYFSGAMLENMLNEAAIAAANRNGAQIEHADLDRAYYTILAGSEKKDRSSIRERDREITAYHEAGHALVAKLTLKDNTVAKITIIPSTKGAGGFCVNVPPDKPYYTKAELRAQIMVSLAGRAAEEIIFGSDMVTTGAGNDLEKACASVRDYVNKYGMGESLYTAGDAAEAECARVTDGLYKQAVELVKENISLLHNIARELIEKETLHEEDLDRICA